MAEFLGNAPASQLLCLMAAPLIGATLLIVMIIVSNRNKSDSTMQLGSSFKRSQPIAPPAPQDVEEADEDEADDLDISVLSNFGSSAKPAPPPVQPPLPPTKPVTTPPPPPPPPVFVEPASLPEPTELLRLLRDSETGQLVVVIAEERYYKLTGVPDKQTGQYIFEVAGHLLAFTNGMVATQTGLKSLGAPKVSALPKPLVTKTPPAPVPVPPAPPPPPVMPPPPINKPVVSAAPPKRPTTRATVPDTTSLLGGFDLAAQINEIVQRRLLLSPLGNTTTIDVATAPEGGIKITVNGLVYSTADEVPDVEARTLLKESIREWERS